MEETGGGREKELQNELRPPLEWHYLGMRGRFVLQTGGVCPFQRQAGSRGEDKKKKEKRSFIRNCTQRPGGEKGPERRERRS